MLRKFRTQRALKGSIRKWEHIVAGTGFDYAARNCPLCELFRNSENCTGCPVQKKPERLIAATLHMRIG